MPRVRGRPIAWRAQVWGRPSATFATSSAQGRPPGWGTGSSWPVIPPRKTRSLSRPWWRVTGRWSWPPAGPCSRASTTSRMRFRPPSWSSPGKAHSIRAGDTLGGWLHRVAYRAAVQAERGGEKTASERGGGIGDGPLERVTSRSRDRPRLTTRFCTRRSTACPKASACRSCFATSKG